MPGISTLVLGCGITALLCQSSRSITWNPSMTDPYPNTNRNVSTLSASLATVPRFQGVGIVRSKALAGTGTLVARRWVLTAKHVVLNSKEGVFFLEGTNIPIVRFTTHPSADLALGELACSTEDYPLTPLWKDQMETNQPVWLVGYGQHGEFTGNPAELSPRFHGRYAARNRIKDLLNVEGLGECLRIFYDKNIHEIPHQGSVAPGDSGSPVFLEVKGIFYLTGITHGVRPPMQGFFFVRIQPYLEWIQSVIK